jgi:hypothetical protein
MPNLTTIAKWAESLGISRQSGYEAVKRCDITVTDGKVDPEYATMLYQRNTRQRANGNRPDPLADGAQPGTPAGAGGGEEKLRVPGYETSRARREAAEAGKAEMELAEMAGKFLLKTDVENSIFEIARGLRDGLINCSRRIAAEVAACTTTEACEAVIDREHIALLESMAQAFESQLGLAVGEAVEG